MGMTVPWIGMYSRNGPFSTVETVIRSVSTFRVALLNWKRKR